MRVNGLQERLLSAHAADDRAGLVALYAQAADESPDRDAACFFLTHAYVFGLETDHPAVPAIHARLRAEGRI